MVLTTKERNEKAGWISSQPINKIEVFTSGDRKTYQIGDFIGDREIALISEHKRTWTYTAYTCMDKDGHTLLKIERLPVTVFYV